MKKKRNETSHSIIPRCLRSPRSRSRSRRTRRHNHRRTNLLSRTHSRSNGTWRLRYSWNFLRDDIRLQFLRNNSFWTALLDCCVQLWYIRDKGARLLGGEGGADFGVFPVGGQVGGRESFDDGGFGRDFGFVGESCCADGCGGEMGGFG